ncbi:MAG: carboxypeptidase-like regulatory domain-containing protein [Polyangiales bacterium]
MKIPSLVLALALASLGMLATPVAAQVDAREHHGNVQACVADHKRVQTTRESGHFLESRDAAARCAQASCPQLIREDCSAWYVDLAASTPSIVLEVRDQAGHDLTDARVTLGERALDVHGRAVSLDTGSYSLRVEAAGHEPHVEQIVVRQGEQNRRVTITLQAMEAASEPVVQAPPPRLSRAVLTLGVIGLAGLSTFGALAIAGKVQRGQLDDYACKPDCARGDVDAINRMYLGANIAAAIGGSAAIAAGVLYVLDRRRAERKLDVALHPMGVSLRGAF